MKLIYAFWAIILSAVIQVSFVRLFDLFLFMPNIAIVVLFLLCYLLPFEKMLVLAIFTGLLIDLTSSISFGSTLLASFSACSLSFYLRNNILKGGRFTDFLLNVLITFIVFYSVLGIFNAILRSLIGYTNIAHLINIDLAGEIIFDFVLSIFGYYLIGRFYSDKMYGFIQNIKISA